MTKDFRVYCPSPMFPKICTFLYFYILSHLFSFWNNFPPPPHLPICLLFLFFFNFIYLYLLIYFILSNHPNSVSTNFICNLKSSLIYKLSLAVLFSAAMEWSAYNNAQFYAFFSFFDVLPSDPTTIGMTLMLLMFHILLISLFSSWYLSMFCFSFLPSLMSPGIAMSIMT